MVFTLLQNQQQMCFSSERDILELVHMCVTNIQGLHECAKVNKHSNMLASGRSSGQDISDQDLLLIKQGFYHEFLDDYSSVMQTDLNVYSL